MAPRTGRDKEFPLANIRDVDDISLAPRMAVAFRSSSAVFLLWCVDILCSTNEGSMRRLLLPLLVLALSAMPLADEGMWTFDALPRAEVARRYGVQLTDAWVERLQKSIVRLETGCTGSFVSPEGLVLTNHHCVATCLSDNSSAGR